MIEISFNASVSHHDSVLKMSSIVKLQNGRFLLVPNHWVQNKNPLRQTKVFYSEDETKMPDFDLNVIYFSKKEDSCYHGYVIKKAGEYMVMIMQI